MPETTPLIKAALNLRGGAGFDVYRRRGDSMLTNTMKEDLTQGLVDLFSDSILAIILYGSVARNDNTDESDIDIVIIIKNEMDDATKEQFIHWSAELDLRYDRVFSIIDIQEENMEKWGNVLPFYQNIQKEGIILWKAE
ncbi:MAG: nucleotidyltransferase domain-containing protein [Lachnospiraceae bacterium]